MDRKGVIFQGSSLTTATSAGGLQTGATILAANSNRAMFIIQNQDTSPLYISFGASASTSVYHLVLKGGTGAHDGNGGTVSMEMGTVFCGTITGASSGTPSYTVMEM